MNKKTFLNKLKENLEILNEEEIEDIIEEYETHINEKVSSGKTEEEAIKDFGDFDLLVKDILSAYKIKGDYKKEIHEKNIITDVIDSFVNFIKEFISCISNKSKNDVVKFIFEFIVLILFIGILKLPVIFIEKLGVVFFKEFDFPFNHTLGDIWKFMIEIIYLILAVAGIVSFVKKRYMNNDYNTSDELKDKNIEKKEANEERTKKEKVKKEGTSFTKVLIVLLKVSLIFIVVPAVFSFIFALALIVVGFILLFQGVPYVGIFLCVVTYLILNYLFLDLSFRFIFDIKLNLKALLITIISTIVLFSVAIGLSFNEVVNTTFVDGVSNDIHLVKKEKEEIYSDSTLLICSNLYHTNCSYEIDETLGDKIEASISFYDYNYEVDDNLNVTNKKEDELKVKNLYNLVIDGLKKRKIYNYSMLNNVDLKIKISSDTKNKMLEKEKKENCEGYNYCNCDDNISCYGYN